MYLAQIFGATPLMALAFLVALGTLLWCILLARRQRAGLDKVLTGLLGLIAFYEALRVLNDSGMVLLSSSRKLDGWADVIIAGLCLVAAMILKISSRDRATTKAQLRLAEASEKPIDLATSVRAIVPEWKEMLFDASPLAAFAVDLHGMVNYWNPAAEILTGWTHDEVLGRPLPFAGHAAIVNKKGQEVDAAVWTSPIHSSDGAMRGSLTIAAGSSALRDAGLTEIHLRRKHPFALQH